MGCGHLIASLLLLSLGVLKQIWIVRILAIILIWVRFSHLKLHLWSVSLLSKLDSVIRKPPFTDKMTVEKKRIMFTWACVEVKEGRRMKQKVEYEWVPASCKYCGIFGHIEARCLKTTNSLSKFGWI